MSGYYPYGQNYGYYYYDEWLLQLLAGLLFTVLVFSVLLAVVFYVFRAIGLHRIAKRRAIRHAWLAWIPVAGEWIMGSVADQYRYVVKGQVKNRRLWLTILTVAVLALSTVSAVFGLDVVAVLLGNMMFGSGSMDPVRLAVVAGVSVLCFAAQVTYTVFYYLAVYDLYSSCTAKYNVVFLVLSIFFRFLEPFFIFSCREKDEGMPPRRTEPEWPFAEDEYIIKQEPLFPDEATVQSEDEVSPVSEE